jgi:hypothetical protein
MRPGLVTGNGVVVGSPHFQAGYRLLKARPGGCCRGAAGRVFRAGGKVTVTLQRSPVRILTGSIGSVLLECRGLASRCVSRLSTIKA